MDEKERAEIAEAALVRILDNLPRISMTTCDWVAVLLREAMHPWIKVYLAEQKQLQTERTERPE